MNGTITEKFLPHSREKTRLNHFQSIHSNEPKILMHQQHFYNELQSLEKEKGQLNCLGLEIIEQEVRQAVNKL